MRSIPTTAAARRTVLTGLVLGMPIGVLFLYLAARGLDPASVRDALSSAKPAPIALAVAVIGVVYCLQAVRWKWVARHVGVAPWRTFLRFIIASVAVNNVVPGRPGDLMRGYWLARELPTQPARAYGTLIVDRSSDVFVLIAMLVGTYPFIRHPAWLHHIVLVALIAGAVIALWLPVTRWYVGSAARGDSLVSERVRRSWVGRQISGLVRGTAPAVNGRDAVVIEGLSCAVWACWALAGWLVAGSLGISMTPVEAVFITAVINLGAAIPSSPGFIGTFQYLSVRGLGLFGVPHASAFAFSLVMLAVWYIPTTTAGVVMAVRSGGRLYRAGRVSELSEGGPAQ